MFEDLDFKIYFLRYPCLQSNDGRFGYSATLKSKGKFWFFCQIQFLDSLRWKINHNIEDGNYYNKYIIINVRNGDKQNLEDICI